MHVRLLVLPAAAVIISAVWLATQRRDLSALEASNRTITTAIARARTDGGAAQDASIANRLRAQPFHRGGKPDWNRIAEAAQRAAGDSSDMRLMTSLQKTLRGLTTEELLEGIDEIRRLDLPKKTRQQIESTLIGILADKDPRLALEKFAPEVLKSDNGGLQWQLSHAFRKWSIDDPAAATAWMDARIADGTFDSKSLDSENLNRVRFEAALIERLAASDPAAAAARLALLPENQRAGVFNHSSFLQLRPGQAKSIAALVRSQLPEDQRLPVLTKLSGTLVHQGGYDRVSRTLGEIDASAAERAAIVGKAIREKITLKHSPGLFEETRAWIATEAPADAERLTGEALAHLTKWQGFEEAGRLALEHQQRSGNDDALVSFLLNAPGNSRFEILELAQRITDPQAREKVNSRFINNPNRQAAPVPAQR